MEGSLSKDTGKIEFSTSRIPRLIFFLVLGTAILCALTQAIGFIRGNHRLFGMTPLFNMDHEESLPTWLNSAILAVCAFLAWAIASQLGQEMKKFAGRWRFLSWIFLLMSIDEVAGLHEIIGDMIREKFHVHGE